MEYLGFAGVPIIIGLVQMAKEAGLPARYAAAVAVCLGVIINAGVTIATGGDVIGGLLLGIAVGLAASGLYSVARTSTERQDEAPGLRVVE